MKTIPARLEALAKDMIEIAPCWSITPGWGTGGTMKHPIRGDAELHRKTYEVVCNKVRKFYGVQDAERFFQARRTAILNQCEQDEFGWAKYGSLLEWHEAVILAARMSPNNAEITGRASGPG